MRTEISAADIDFNKRLALLEYCLWRFKRKVDDFLSRPQGGNEEEVAECQKKVQQAQAAAKAAEQAEKELTVALRNLKQQEDAYNSKTKELEAKTETGGAVAKNKAKAELAQHLGADPLPLSRAKLTTEAAKKKSGESNCGSAGEDCCRGRILAARKDERWHRAGYYLVDRERTSRSEKVYATTKEIK